MPFLLRGSFIAVQRVQGQSQRAPGPAMQPGIEWRADFGWFPSVLHSASSIFLLIFLWLVRAVRGAGAQIAQSLATTVRHAAASKPKHPTPLKAPVQLDQPDAAAAWRGSYHSSPQPPRWTGQRPDSRTPSATAARAYGGSARSRFIDRPTARPHHSRSPARRGP